MQEFPLPESEVAIQISNQQPHPVDLDRFLACCRRIVDAMSVSGSLSVVLLTDPEIHRINREYLDHDWPTDVISFSYADVPATENEPCEIEGELFISVDTALAQATKQNWSLQDELLLYFTHGFLHICGYDDLTDTDRPRMRQKERELLAPFGLSPQGLEH